MNNLILSSKDEINIEANEYFEQGKQSFEQGSRKQQNRWNQPLSGLITNLSINSVFSVLMAESQTHCYDPRIAKQR